MSHLFVAALLLAHVMLLLLFAEVDSRIPSVGHVRQVTWIPHGFMGRSATSAFQGTAETID